MKKKYVVKQSKEFSKIIKHGTCLKNRSFVIHYMENNYNYDRYGISVSKKLGNAVFRNKYKRRIRNIVDNYKKTYDSSKDYIIILRKGGVDISYQELEKDFIKLMKRQNNNKKEEKK